eukprot:TRINITY_DN32645_c0_g4_i10.p3 TRINITY_DN32645_c0_g4~~TRINITY_DN32645_c0_g4_i10.p3  ORF type:complete len:134 (+),score=28.88 TRINITY_DN32645_c0_g4_i10:921-1322(+)
MTWMESGTPPPMSPSRRTARNSFTIMVVLIANAATGETEEDEDDDLPEPTLEDLGIVEEREDFTHQEQVGARLEAELEAAIAGLAKQIAQSKDSGLDAATQARMLKLAPRVKDLQLCPIAGTLPDGFRHSRLG